MEPWDIHLFTENWNERFRIDTPLFAPGPNRVNSADAQFLLKAVLIVRIDTVLFPAKHAAEGQPNTTCGQIKQVGRVDVQVQCRELRGKKVPRF